MRPVRSFSSELVADLVRRQPASPARTAFAWQLVVGPALARTTSVEMDGTALRVRSADARWLKEIERAKPAILAKLQHVLGRDHITTITTRR